MRQILSDKRLTSALLTGRDLAGGYITASESPIDTAKPSYFCNYTPHAVQKVRAERDFTATADVNESIQVSLRQYADVASAKSAYGDLAKAMQTCKGETSDGTMYTYATAAITPVGDAEALRIRSKYKGGASTQDFAVSGPTIVSVWGGGGTIIPDDAALQNLLTKQVNRYARLSGTVSAAQDSDGDGTPDVSDAFPFDKSETTDANHNDIGDHADAALTAKIAKAKFLSAHDLALLVKDPVSHAGEVIRLWGNVTQFDSATGDSNFLADIAATDTTQYGYFQGESAYFGGDAKLLKNLVQKDTFTATVRVIGSITYETSDRGSNTTPFLAAMSIHVQ